MLRKEPSEIIPIPMDTIAEVIKTMEAEESAWSSLRVMMAAQCQLLTALSSQLLEKADSEEVRSQLLDRAAHFTGAFVMIDTAAREERNRR